MRYPLHSRVSSAHSDADTQPPQAPCGVHLRRVAAVLVCMSMCLYAVAGVRHSPPTLIGELDALCVVAPTFSPDGSMLALCVAPLSAVPGEASEMRDSARYRGWDIAAMPSGGGPVRIITPNDGESSWGTWFSWSPNNAHIICGYSDADFAGASAFGVAGYGIVSVQSGLTEHGHYREDEERPMWDPNQPAQEVLASPAQAEELWREAEAAGIAQNPDPYAPRAGDPFLVETRETRDPATRFTVAKHSLWVRNRDGSKGPLIMDETRLGLVRVSPDRATGLIQTRDGQLLLVRGDGTDLTPVRSDAMPSPDECYLSLGTWRPDSKQFAFSTRPRDSEPGDIVCRIWSFDILEDPASPPNEE